MRVISEGHQFLNQDRSMKVMFWWSFCIIIKKCIKTPQPQNYEKRQQMCQPPKCLHLYCPWYNANQTQSDVQVPCLWISCSETLWLKAMFEPERLKLWKVTKSFSLSIRVRTFCKCLLTQLSDKGIQFEWSLNWKNWGIRAARNQG